MSDDHRFLVERWMQFARSDLAAAQILDSPRHKCFLSQQAAEKALKALLVVDQIDFPRTHDLDVLRDLVAGVGHVVGGPDDLRELTEWAVEARYGVLKPDPRPEQAAAAYELASSIVESVSAMVDAWLSTRDATS